VHPGLIQKAILHEPLGKASDRYATRAANCGQSVIIHGLTWDPGIQLRLVYYQRCNDQLSNHSECSHTPGARCVILIPKRKSPRPGGGFGVR